MTSITHDPAEQLTPRSGTLLSLSDYKALRQIPSGADSTLDPQLNLALSMADNVIEEYTGRDFTSAPATLTKKYRYDGSGILDIDDCSTIQNVAVQGYTVNPALDVIAGPIRGPMFYWIEFAFDGPSPNTGSRGQMGFTRNLDNYGSVGRSNAYFIFVEVTATFGWAEADLPGSVKQAAAWLVDDFATEAAHGAGQEGRVTSEQIADLGYSYSIEPPQPGTSGATAISSRVRALLDPLSKPEI